MRTYAVRTFAVIYEAWFVPSKAAYARFGEALIKHHVALVDSYTLGVPARVDTAVIMIKGSPAAVAAFAIDAKLPELPRYCSPTHFDNGQIFAIYASSDDEVLGKKTERALEFETRYKEHEG